MDFSDLDDMLDEGGYVPTFGKQSKPGPAKALLKNNSSKSIDSLGLPPPPAQPRTNLLQLHKDTRTEVTTFEEFFKQGKSASPSPKPPSPPKTSNDAPSRSQRSSSPAKAEKRDDLNINNLLDEEDEGVGSRRGMRPPLSRKNNEGRSVASRRNEDNKSVASVSEIKKEEIKSSEVAATLGVSKMGGDPGEWRKLLEDQLQAQRDTSSQMCKQMQGLHKAELDRMQQLHKEELRRKLELKDLELANIRENYQLQLKTLRQSVQQESQLQTAAARLAKGLESLERAELQFKSQSQQLASEQQQQSQIATLAHHHAQTQENSLKQLLDRLEAREQEFREEKGRVLAELERSRFKNQEEESRLARREKELEDAFRKKEKNLLEEAEQKRRKLAEEEGALRVATADFEHQKQRFLQEREETLSRTKLWEEARTKASQEAQLEKIKLLTREAELSSREQEWENKTAELLFREKDLEAKIKLVEAQRNKLETQREASRRTEGLTTQNSRVAGLPARRFEEVVPTGLEKSLKQLKDQYLKNLGHF